MRRPLPHGASVVSGLDASTAQHSRHKPRPDAPSAVGNDFGILTDSQISEARLQRFALDDLAICSDKILEEYVPSTRDMAPAAFAVWRLACIFARLTGVDDHHIRVVDQVTSSSFLIS